MRKHTNRIVKFTVAPCVALLLLALTLFAKPEQAQPAAVETDGGIALQPPAFLKSAIAQDAAQVDFGLLVEEAGITAYTKLDQEIDLMSLESYFKTIRQQTDQFISGIITVPGYEKLTEFAENAEVQVFLHHDGWIVAYLTRWQLASVLFDWVKYDEKRLGNSTLIENVVRSIALNVGVSDFNVSYYDFRHPEATNLMLAADHTVSGESFTITIPRGLTVYESSWSHAKFSVALVLFSGNWIPALGECKLNDETLSSVNPGESKWRLATGEFSQAKFPLGTNHTLNISGGNTPTYCGIAIIYREAAK